MAIHGRIYTNYSSLDHSPILKLYRYLFAVEFLQELDELHGLCSRRVVVAERKAVWLGDKWITKGSFNFGQSLGSAKSKQAPARSQGHPRAELRQARYVVSMSGNKLL